MITERQLESFHKKYQKVESGCWEWTAYVDEKGYGQLRVGSTKNNTRKVMDAHIASYLIHKGSRNGLHVCHTCDNRKCVNPEHLFLGTHADNMADMKAKGRAKGREQKGHLNANCKLKEQDVLEIFKLLPEMNNKEIASLFGVAHSTISGIRLGKSWNHLAVAQSG